MMGSLVRQPMLMARQISEHTFVPSGGYCLNKAMIGFLRSLGVSRYTLKKSFAFIPGKTATISIAFIRHKTYHSYNFIDKHIHNFMMFNKLTCL